MFSLKNSSLKRTLLLGLVLLVALLCLTACKTGKTALPAPDPMYDNPLEDPVYEKAVMESEPEFTEKELLKAMLDVEPVTDNGMDTVLDHLVSVGWERNRAYYVLTKTAVAEFILTDGEDAEYFLQDYPQGKPTANELDLVRKNRAAVHKGMGME